MSEIHYILLAFASILLTSCVTNEPILPSKLVKYEYLSIHAPNSDGWKLTRYRSGIIFSHEGKTDYDSYIAQVTTGELSKQVTNEEFLKIVEYKAQFYNRKRFKMIESKVELSSLRRHACVESKQLVEDSEASVSSRDKRILLLASKSLYCLDQMKDSFFMVAYTYRGKKIPKLFYKEADIFLNGVQIINR